MLSACRERIPSPLVLRGTAVDAGISAGKLASRRLYPQ